MYKRIRLKLTLLYVALSAVTFASLAAIGTVLCYESISTSLSHTLESIIAHTITVVDIDDNGLPHFKKPSAQLSSEWARMRATVQIYDTRGRLLSAFGPPGVEKLCPSDYVEQDFGAKHLLGVSDPIRKDGSLIGHLQVELSTEPRDVAVSQFVTTIAWLAPLLLLILAGSGYFFAAKASKPAEDAFRTLQQFLSDAGHELRTPVHLIQLTAENAMQDYEQDETLSKDLSVITRATDRMSRLVDDMMMLAKMEVQQLKLKRIPVRMDEVVASAVAEYTVRANEKSIGLSTVQSEQVTTTGDPDSLHRAVANLIENALRYTDSGGSVRVNLARANGSIMLSVADTGMGIPAESLPHIFKRFYRVDQARAREAGGSGLGLAITKAICEVHQGNIQVASELGKGTTFTISLPVAENG